MYYALITLGVALLLPNTVHAGPEFISLTNIPGLTTFDAGEGVNLPEMLGNLFVLTIGFAAVLGVLMFAIGGVQYMMSDKWTSKADGRSKMMAALQGIFIILTSYLILYTINPDLLKVDLLTPAVSGPGGPVSRPVIIFDSIPRDAAQATTMRNICTNAGGVILEYSVDGSTHMRCIRA